MEYTLIITAWKEAETIKSTLEMILNPVFRNILPQTEIILACPDEETYLSALSVINHYSFNKFTYIKDPQKGKPVALNMALKVAKGKVIICTDGDVIIDKGAIPNLVKPFNDPIVSLVTGRPISADAKNTMFGYFGNLLADVAHKKREIEFGAGGFYFVSGYLYAMKRVDGLEIPWNSLVDDAWVTLQFVKNGSKIVYAPDAKVLVKYPKNMNEWLKQKKRSMGGYSQLAEINNELPAKYKKSRGITDELKFVLFPITYAKSLRELAYSLYLYPARLWLWIAIWWERYVYKKSFEETWGRIESTK